MRIDRIKSVNLTGLGDVDWTFPLGPVLFISEASSYQPMLEILLELFYDYKTPSASMAHSRQGLLEVWISEGSTRYHIRRKFGDQNAELDNSSMLIMEDESGQSVSLPKTMTLGEYLFRVSLQAFLQGGVVNWPERNERDNFFRRARNLRQGGDEELSLTKVRASIAGAQKRVNEQKENMMQVKDEYDGLRRDWEAAHRQQEEERSLQIEIRNLHEKEAILADRIASTEKLQERLVVLRENLDYRELRKLQGEVTQLEERCQESASALNELTRESQVDLAMIESLHEECMVWASLEEKVGYLAAKTQIRVQKINETQTILQTSGYHGLSENEDQNLSRAEEERYLAQKELDKLPLIKLEIEKLQIRCTEENAQLKDFAVMAGVTEADEIEIAQKERRLAQWQSSKISGTLDRVLQKQFSWTGIGERLSIRLSKYYQSYQVSNYQEFTSQLRKFRDQCQEVERSQKNLERLQDKLNREEILCKIVHSRNNFLKRAFSAVKAADYSAWLNGWKEHQRTKDRLARWREKLHLELEQLEMEEKTLTAYTDQLREKLGNWVTPTTDRDEVLATVLKVAGKLQAKEKTEKEFALVSQRFYELLGDRKMEQLANILEPLADLEREIHHSDEELLAELTARENERADIRRQQAVAEQRLKQSRKFPTLSVLEKKIETVKQQWVSYEDLCRALDDALTLLEASYQEWQTKNEKALKEEVKWILTQISSSTAQEKIERDLAEAKRDYFTYRMAVAQLALSDNTEVPLFFSVGEMNEGQSFWDEVVGYLRKLSNSRQVFLGTTDPKVWQKLAQPVPSWR